MASRFATWVVGVSPRAGRDTDPTRRRPARGEQALARHSRRLPGRTYEDGGVPDGVLKRKREARLYVVAVRGEERSRPSAGKVARVGFIDCAKKTREGRTRCKKQN